MNYYEFYANWRIKSHTLLWTSMNFCPYFSHFLSDLGENPCTRYPQSTVNTFFLKYRRRKGRIFLISGNKITFTNAP